MEETTMKRSFRFGTRPFLFVLALCVLSLPLLAEQKTEPTWDNLKHLKEGTRIKVIDMNKKSKKAVLLAVTDETLSYRTNKGQTSLNRSDVYKVINRDKNHHRLSGFIGMAMGAGFFAVQASRSNISPSRNGSAAVGAAVGGATLGTIGFACGFHQTAYQAERVTPKKKPN
jgi:hypothetical protein